ncbi:hypothetical protein K466DRAFT_489162 [Polyporus arcularius HHB13444]|uniref:Uncharacterized protein n=1 Tax=Polyporus arcularius HHB13444 TaxID=1314778 RepID=A0A5C3PQH0_9APHY|nr:hypothetical protein K466DRAFT_489162 [Polyporus arcularius HHB13444]
MVQVDFSCLTRAHLLSLAKGRLALPRDARKTKETLVEYMLTHGDEALLDALTELAQAQSGSRKRPRAEVQQERRVAQRVEERVVGRDISNYLALPTDAQQLDCFRQFHDATSGAALQIAVCAVCAREVSVRVDEVQLTKLTELPNRSRLFPRVPHPKHDIYHGCLLDPAGSVRLQVVPQDPWISPCVRGGRRSATLQRGMKGTVSTYEMDTSGIVDMLEGRLMPRLPDVLAKVISVTFVGVGPLPKRWLRTTFRVRRPVVHAALLHLQQEHRHYTQIQISQERLLALPEDDVPEELLGVVRHCSDPGVTLQEHGGYVPQDDDDVPGAATPADRVRLATADVIPLQVSGSIDTDLTRTSANDLMLWGLRNLWKASGEGGYSVRHGQTPVSDFGRPRRADTTTAPASTSEPADAQEPPANYFERAFPCLFPYGFGGIEGDQPEPVDFKEHVRWALQYHDRRFRKHETFPFVMFAIEQRREALGSARIQIRRKTFEQELRVLSAITLDTLKRASEDEAAKRPIQDPAVLLLKRLVHGAAGRVQGTDAARYKIRAQIWSTSLVYGPPSMWITINPSDIHDPIAQFFAGESINLDNFLASAGPDAARRAMVIADDPYAAARFFHFLTLTILETLFQIRVTPYSVKSGTGVLGKAAAYVGSVESQGRGSLHLHMLLWLHNTPRSEQLQELLRQEDFRTRVLAYIRANIRAYLTGLETAASVKAIPKDNDIPFSLPPHPDSPDYDAAVADYELRLARAQQVHTCKVKRCLRFNAKGSLECKRRAPFERAEDDYVKDDGRWGPKRLYRYMNGWIPSVLVHGRCNNDGKLLTNGADTKNITFYVSSYAGKKQAKNHNMSAILADGFAYDQLHKRNEYMNDIREQQRLLLFRLMNSINREQELAGPMVMSYLMGWSDVKTSHSYSPLYWSSFIAALFQVFPSLRNYARCVTFHRYGGPRSDRPAAPAARMLATRTHKHPRSTHPRPTHRVPLKSASALKQKQQM